MRGRQFNRGFIEAVLTKKHNDDKFEVHDYDVLKRAVTEQLALLDPANGIRIDMNGYYREVFRCSDLQSFLWLIGITRGMAINEKEVKLSAINEGTSYYFYTMLPVPYKEKFHRQFVPLYNDDLVTSHWMPTEFYGRHVIYEVDLLSACLLYDRQYVLHYKQTAYNLALLCELD